ncbi:HNH endonuclease domain-containing protein [Mycoplasma todarodis]|uniref:HNH endonuclease n=1 Tax=Mycoplasma todarodis TaxID=1937191 RepID=A0A4R0XN14_9MOLU|nr:HNH endonuclease domain-containing protein [Mycoplasma todarodis]TCG12111.1 hypothetical protein C4B25_00250 [Mycoplasma todarodis]
MSFNREQRIKIWKRYFPYSNSAVDVFGRNMNINNFQADHIWPEAEGGRNVIENGIPLSALSNQEKNDEVKGIVNGKSFSVRWDKVNKGIGMLYIGENKVSK